MAKVYEIFNAVSRCTCGINDLLAKSDFTDEDIDAICNLSPGQQWTASGGEFSIERMKDAPGAYGPRNVWFPKHRQCKRRTNDARRQLATAVSIEACEKIISMCQDRPYVIALARGILDAFTEPEGAPVKPGSEARIAALSLRTGCTYKVKCTKEGKEVEITGIYHSRSPTGKRSFKVTGYTHHVYIDEGSISSVELVKR